MRKQWQIEMLVDNMPVPGARKKLAEFFKHDRGEHIEIFSSTSRLEWKHCVVDHGDGNESGMGPGTGSHRGG